MNRSGHRFGRLGATATNRCRTLVRPPKMHIVSDGPLHAFKYTWLGFFAATLLFAVVGCETATQTNGRATDASTQFQKQFQSAKAEGSREFIFRESVTATELQQLTQLDLQRVELFNLESVPSEQIANALRAWPDLRRLRIESGTVDDQVMGSIAELKVLEVLNIPNGEFSDIGLAAICSLPKLMLLRAGSPDVTDESVRKLVELPALRFLHLINVPLTDNGLAAFHDFHQLESFYIDNGKETENGIRSLLEKHNHRLHFHRNQIHIPDDPSTDQHAQ